MKNEEFAATMQEEEVEDFPLYSDTFTQEELIEHNEIMNAIDTKGYVTKSQAEKLLSFDRKYRLCNCCKKSHREAGPWLTFKLNGYNVGLTNKCLKCTLEEILKIKNNNE